MKPDFTYKTNPLSRGLGTQGEKGEIFEELKEGVWDFCFFGLWVKGSIGEHGGRYRWGRGVGIVFLEGGGKPFNRGSQIRRPGTIYSSSVNVIFYTHLPISKV